MLPRHVLLLIASLTLSTPASALLIGMSPDPVDLTPAGNTDGEVEFLGGTVGTAPAGAMLLDGAIGAGDDVLHIRFTNTGTSTWNLAAIIPAVLGDFTITAVGWTAGFAPISGDVVDPTFAGVAVALPAGESIDVFFSLAGVIPGAQVLFGGYGPLVPAEGSATLLLPEPSVCLPVLCAAALLARARRAAALR